MLSAQLVRVQYLLVYLHLFHLIFTGKLWILIRIAMHGNQQQGNINDGETDYYFIIFGKLHRRQLIFRGKEKFL